MAARPPSHPAHSGLPRDVTSSDVFPSLWQEFLLIGWPDETPTQAATEALQYMQRVPEATQQLESARARFERFQKRLIRPLVALGRSSAAMPAPVQAEALFSVYADYFTDFYALNESFLLREDDKASFDFAALEFFYCGSEKAFRNKGDTEAAVEQCVTQMDNLLSLCIEVLRTSPGDRFVVAAQIRFVFILAGMPFFDDMRNQRGLQKLHTLTSLLPEKLKMTISDWYLEAGSTITLRHLESIHQLITLQVMSVHAFAASSLNPNKAYRRCVREALMYMKLLHDANRKRARLYSETLPTERDGMSPPLPSSIFHNDGINSTPTIVLFDFAHRQSEVNARRRASIAASSPPQDAAPIVTDFDLLHHPFALDAANKRTYFMSHVSAVQQERRFSAFVGLLNDEVALFNSEPELVLRVRRSELIYDSLRKLTATVSRENLQKPLRVIFDDEAGIDEGGVAKEFFQLLVEQLFNPDYGMFEYLEDVRVFWFNPNSLETSLQFELIGVVLGLAIFNGVILDLHFPACVYKKLLNLPTTIDDLQDFKPAMYSNFVKLLSMKEEEVNASDLSFGAAVNKFGHMETEPLSPEIDPDTPVTMQNRDLFVRLYTEWTLDRSIAPQFDAFKRGFCKCVEDEVFQLLNFEPEELTLVLCGSPHLDLKALESVTQYQDGYTKESETIEMFWEVAHSLSEEDKKKLLFFITGSDRVPILGLSSLNFYIGKNGSETERIPTAHTCFNYLFLPDYKDKRKLEKYLRIALENHTGFGLR